MTTMDVIVWWFGVLHAAAYTLYVSLRMLSRFIQFAIERAGLLADVGRALGRIWKERRDRDRIPG